MAHDGGIATERVRSVFTTTRSRIIAGVGSLAVAVGAVAIVAPAMSQSTAEPVAVVAQAAPEAPTADSVRDAVKRLKAQDPQLESKLLPRAAYGSGFTRPDLSGMRSEAKKMLGQFGGVNGLEGLSEMLGSVDVSPEVCTRPGARMDQATGHAYRAAVRGDSVFAATLAGQVIGQFQDAAQVEGLFAELDARLADCSSVTISTKMGEANITIDVQTMNIAGADDARLLTITANVGGFMSMSSQVAVVSSGDLVTAVARGSMGSGSSGTPIRELAQLAADRL